MRLFNPGSEKYVIDSDALQKLLDILRTRGYTTIGPTVKDQVITLDEIHTTKQLPIGWTDEQGGGTYRLIKRHDNACFGYVLTSATWKQFLHAPSLKLFSAKKNGKGFEVIDYPPETVKRAFIGVRACELNAIASQDKIFYEGEFKDASYIGRRENVFIVAVNCGNAGPNCFCSSMGTGPKVDKLYDIALTEILEETRHYFVAETGTDLGGEILLEVTKTPATEEEVRNADKVVSGAASQITKKMDTSDLRELLNRNTENKQWDIVAKRCMSCANCTMVCPTCFCTTVQDTTDLSGEHAERWRKWDSCFSVQFSYIHGGSIRSTPKARYRQWMMHKLSNWIDQFGESGCVGCGRCITWCPVGIDLTEEAAAIRAGEKKVKLEEDS
jgi:formate hydrogenlyase subunit 6/NADH:ubiquinone oxidoreductase subunit I